ncbi:hypothetical protein ABF162_07235 [Vibrio coralliilyticus]|nr:MULTISPECIES: hypothetical protein [Vibrio]
MNRKQLIERVSQQAELSKQEAIASLIVIIDAVIFPTFKGAH